MSIHRSLASGGRPGWRAVAGAAGLYAVAIVWATWPVARDAATSLPHGDLGDPLLHLWILRWYRDCLVGGRFPLWCAAIQQPVGAPLGYMPGLHFQALCFLPISAVIRVDALAYNLVWFGSLLFTGLGGFAIGWRVSRSRACATLAGLGFVLSTPVMFNAHGALEMLSIGWFPLFLIAWMAFVDRPGVRTCAVAAVLYAAMLSGAPYFGILGAFPAALYLAFESVRALRSGSGRAWLRGTLPGLVGFAAAVIPVAAFAFSSQIWAMAHGFPMTRPDSEFDRYGASLLGYVLPAPSLLLQRAAVTLGRWPAVDLKVPSYLGVVTLGLLAYAAALRVRFDRRAYWWSALGLLVLLSLGSTTRLGPFEVPLPAAWLRDHTPIFRPIRVPARFNLFAAAVAVAIASAGLRDLIGRLPGRRARVLLVGGLGALAVADLSNAPFPTTRIPEVPEAYAHLRSIDPGATVLDVPQGDVLLSSLCAYWSSIHGLPTSAGYTSFPNADYEHLITETSPFQIWRLDEPESPGGVSYDLAGPADPLDYTWLYLTAHDYRFVVLHKGGHAPPRPFPVDRLRELLLPARIWEDESVVVFDRDRIPAPSSPVLMAGRGYGARLLRGERRVCAVEKSASLVLYNPGPSTGLRLSVELAAYRSARKVTLLHEGRVLANWDAAPGPVRSVTTQPLDLPEGLVELELFSDSDQGASESLSPLGQTQDFSLWVAGLGIEAGGIARGDSEPTR